MSSEVSKTITTDGDTATDDANGTQISDTEFISEILPESSEVATASAVEIIEEEDGNTFPELLRKLKDNIHDEFKEEEKEIEDVESNDTLRRYKVTCTKYKLLPLKTLVADIDKEIVDLSDAYLGSLQMKPILETLLFSATLTHLIVPGNRMELDGLEDVANLVVKNSNIKHLNLSNNMLGPQGGTLLKKILIYGESLEHLDISENALEDAQLNTMLPGLQDCVKLRELVLSSNNFMGNSAKVLGDSLASNERLEKLDLGYNRFKKDASFVFLALRKNSSLKTLILSSNEIGHECAPDMARALGSNQSLVELDLGYNRLILESMAVISKSVKKNNTLKSLNLCFNPIRAIGASVLLSALTGTDNQIERLNLLGVRVNPAFMKTLHKLKSDRSIDVKFGNRIRETVDVEKIELSPLEEFIQVADTIGLNPKVVLQKIHNNFLIENRLSLAKLNDEAKAAAGKKETVQIQEPDMYPRMQGDKFAQVLTSSIKVPQDIARKLKDAFIDDKNTVDVGEVIAQLPIRADTFEFEMPPPPESAVGKKKDAKGKKKK